MTLEEGFEEGKATGTAPNTAAQYPIEVGAC